MKRAAVSFYKFFSTKQALGPWRGVSDALGANKTPSEELVASVKSFFSPLSPRRMRESNVS
jgi:hypothetical protein